MTGFSLYLLALHCLGDFVLQTDWMAAQKLDDPVVRLAHVAVYTAAVSPILFATSWSWRAGVLFVALVAVTHFIADSQRWKAPTDAFPTRPVWFDQALHVISLAATVALVEVLAGTN